MKTPIFSSLRAALRTAFLGVLSMLILPPPMRARTSDVAFTFRMGAGFPGDVNRTNPFSVIPALINTTTPPRLYGDPVLVNAADNSVRGFVVGDTTTPTTIYGVAVRPFPTQQQSGGMAAAIGAAAPPTSGVIDVLRSGFIMTKIPPGVTVAKGGAVYVWFAATSGNNIQGGFVGSLTGGSSALVSNAKFNGPADANGNVEIEVWPA